MSALYVAARAVHYASAILLFGGLVFILAVARAAWTDVHATTIASARPGLRRTTRVVGLVSIVLGLLSGAAWLVSTAAQMTGMPLDQALSGSTLSTVLSKTLFGRVWMLRAALLIAMGALLPVIAASDYKHRAPVIAVIGTALAGINLASLAWAGHAAAGEGIDKLIQLSSDAIHLLAAGAWLGALPALVYFLRAAPSHAAAARATQRFSTLGVASVAALLASGIANTWYLVGNVPALIGTDYGRLLLVKIALFVAMLALAATNRWRLTPRMVDHDAGALHALRRNATLETVAGVVVIVIVGLLGITVPAVHQAPVWPFAYTLSWSFSHHSPAIHLILIIAIIGALACAVVTATGLQTRRRRLTRFGLAGAGAASAVAIALLIVPAYPTTYVKSPLRYNIDAIVHGAKLYAQSCSTCHGDNGLGDGPLAPSLAVKPPNLVEHAARHRAGELFWLTAHGTPEASMPAFSPQLDDGDIWSVVQFLRAQADAQEAQRLTADVSALHAIVAPDFTYELGEHGQESLQSQNGRSMTLLVLYSPPQSLHRVKALAAEHHVLARDGLRVIALPITGQVATPDELERMPNSEWILPRANANVTEAYRLFTRTADGDITTAHAELLIDRQGLMRARWLGLADSDEAHLGELHKQVEMLKKEKVAPRIVERHGH